MSTLTAEQIKQNIEAYEKWLNGAEIQRVSEVSGIWCSMSTESKITPYDILRIKPVPRPPEYVPWSFETRPLAPTWVYKKGFITDSLITAWGDDCVIVATKHGNLKASYDELLDKWLCRDGSPCGTLKPHKVSIPSKHVKN